MNFRLSNFQEFSIKAQNYASKFQPCVILDSCEIKPQYNQSNYKLVIGFGGNKIIEPTANKIVNLFNQWEISRTWMFGVLGYNLKNELESLASNNSKCFNWPDLSFFIPTTVLTVDWEDNLVIYDAEPLRIFEIIFDTIPKLINRMGAYNKSSLKTDFEKQDYLATVAKIKEEIKQGNVYELNLCERFLYTSFSLNDPFELFQKLLSISPAPFSAFASINNKFVLSASPERYLSISDNKAVSQPIKGTRPRGKDKEEDKFNKEDLISNLKDRAENVMIVDLVRNDLSKVSKPGSILVDELFGIYSYSHVHQMVSTISSKLENTKNWSDAIIASFPMGSMTGAPKIAAMKFIEELEIMDREWYSGSIGYISPNGNCDFNVLIRSIFYDSKINSLAYYAGGAITIDSNAEEEYQEMLIKTKAIRSLISFEH